MRGIQFLAAVLVVLALTAGSAQAQTWTWTGAGDGTNWLDPDNWDTPPGDANIPGIGDYAGDTVEVGIDNATLDLGTTNVTLGQFMTKHRDTDNVTVQGTGTITATTIVNSDRCNNLNLYPNLVVSGRIYNDNKGNIGSFYGTVTADSLDLGATSPLFHKAVTITNVPDGLEAFYRSVATGGDNNWRFGDVLNASKVRIWSDVVGQTSTIAAEHADTLSGVTGAVTIDSGGILNLVAAQNTFPGGGILVNAGGALYGDTAAATWGDGNDIEIAVDAILKTTTVPTTSDLGLVSGAKDAVAWKPVIDNGTYEYGDDGDSIWKGVVVGSFTTSLANKTLVAPASAGDLEVKWLGRTYNKQQIKMDAISRDGTGVADFAITGPMFSSWNGDTGNFTSGFNLNSSDANAVTTFNLNMLPGSPATDLVQLGNDFRCKDDQTFNLTGQGRADVNPEDWNGVLTASGLVMIDIIGTQRQFESDANDPNVALTFHEAAALRIPNNQVNVLELLSPGQLTLNGNLLVALERGSDITDANQPVLAGVLTQAHIAVAGGDNSITNSPVDFVVGVDKWLMSRSGRTDRPTNFTAAAPGVMIRTTAGLGESFGIASIQSGGSIDIEMPIDANGATLLVNSKLSADWIRDYNNAARSMNGWVYLNDVIHNAAEVRLGAGTIQIEDETIDDGTLAGDVLPIVVEDQAGLQFNASVAVLADTQIEIEQGGRMYVNNGLTVKNLILNSTYAAGNDGLQINDAADIVTVTGTLSGNGEWGDSGRIVVDSSGTVAPGNDVGTLTGTNLELADGATYEWEIVDLDANAGVGWDLVWANLVDFDAEDDEAGALTFRIVDAGLADDIEADNEFIVAAGDTFDIPDNWMDAVTFEAPTGWDVTAAHLALGDPFDVDGDGDTENTLRLTGVVSVSTLGTLAWSAGADGAWGADAPGNWALVGEWQGEGGEPNYPNHPYIAAVVDTPWTVNVQDANQQAYTLEVRGGGTVDVKPGRALTLTRGAAVEADGTLTVGGALTAEELALTGGAMNVSAGATVTAEQLTVSGGSLILAEDVEAMDVEITGGTLDTGDKGIILTGTLKTPEVVVTSDAPSFQAMGAGRPGEVIVGMTANNSITTIAAAAGAGKPLTAPAVSLRSATDLAYVEFNADEAVIGDLLFANLGGIQLPTGTDVSVRDLSGAGQLLGDVTVRGTVRPGSVPDWLDVFGSVTLAPGAAFGPEVQGPDPLGTLYVDQVLDLTAADDMLAISWTPTGDPSSAFGGPYVVAEVFEIEGAFDVLGGGNIGEAYIASVAYDVDLGGAFGIEVTLYDLLDGDVDLDGTVDGGDLDAMAPYFNEADTSRLEGDLTYDGRTDHLDYLAWKIDAGNSVPGLIPEPATLLLLALGACGLLAGKRSGKGRRG